MKRLYLVILMAAAVMLAACGAEPTAAPTKALPTVAPPPTATQPAATAAPTQASATAAPTDTTFESPLDMANPASVSCVDQGYKLEIRDEAGGQVGYCVFPNGAECEEWAFFRGECTIPETYP
jgi:putative hemolysin